MAYQSEISKVLEIPTNFYIGHLIGGKGKTIRDIQKLTGAKINIKYQRKTTKIPRGFQSSIELGLYPGIEPKALEIRGSSNDVKSAEEFVLAFFKLRDPSEGSDGFDKHSHFISEIVSKLPTDSILREKIVTFSPRFLAKKMPQNKLTTPQFFSDVYY